MASPGAGKGQAKGYKSANTVWEGSTTEPVPSMGYAASDELWTIMLLILYHIVQRNLCFLKTN